VANDLSITSEPASNSNVTIMHLTGNLNSRSAEQLASAIQGFYDQSKYKIVMDMKNVGHISSAGVSVLVNAITHAQDHEGGIVFVSISESIRHGALRMIGLTDMIRMADDLPTAVKQFEA
jgi:anti-anti-sigma factor